ncbi:MAG: glycosyltransferase family 1 protein [Eubacteriales bacterium]|nr:glycosyltransferase family 1 protein [Eubacteriales bacterium]
MKKYLIDGRFLASLTTGIDRYAEQVLNEFDKICTDNIDISILVPANAKKIPEYHNIKVIKSARSKHWTQLVFGGYALFHGMIPINLCNEVSIIAPRGIVCLHDVCYAETPQYYPGIEDFPQDEIQWFRKLYKRIVKKADILITVSEFSKQRITRLLGVDENKIHVIGNGWQHFIEVKSDCTLLDKYQKVKAGQYYFTLTSANKNKNVDWVLSASKYNPSEIFVIAGKNLDKIVDFSVYPNVVYVGYASDELSKTLMKYCKAFVFPSYYEGFGIPPLEAMSAGADVIVSEAASLPEIFGKSAHYISAYNPNVNLSGLMKENVSGKEEVLEKYSWKKAAKKLYELL